MFVYVGLCAKDERTGRRKKRKKKNKKKKSKNKKKKKKKTRKSACVCVAEMLAKTLSILFTPLIPTLFNTGSQGGNVRHIRILNKGSGFAINPDDDPCPSVAALIQQKMGKEMKSK